MRHASFNMKKNKVPNTAWGHSLYGEQIIYRPDSVLEYQNAGLTSCDLSYDIITSIIEWKQDLADPWSSTKMLIASWEKQERHEE